MYKKIIILFLFCPLLGFGQIEFTEHLIDSYNTSSQPLIIDFDNDGDLDIHTGHYNNWDWYENDGNQSFTKNTNANFGAEPSHLADLDNDGDLDIIVISNKDFSWYENDGNQNYTKHLIDDHSLYRHHNQHSSNYSPIVDFDSDGDIDIIIYSREIATSEYRMTLLLNDGNQNFTKTIILPEYSYNISYNSAIYSVDIDSDNDQDIVFSSPPTSFSGPLGGNSIFWIENRGNSDYVRNILVDNISAAFIYDFQDIDNDNDIDFVTHRKSLSGGSAYTGDQSSELIIFENDSNQVFTKHSVNLDDNSSPYLYKPTFVDFNGDGLIDVFASYSSKDKKAEVYENNGNYVFTKIELVDNSQIVLYEDVDFDNDGDIDIVGINYWTRNMVWLENVTVIDIDDPKSAPIIPDNTLNDRNWTATTNYDINGVVRASNISYYNELGKNIQNQMFSIKTGNVWASQTLYDVYGRPAFKSFSAPIGATGAFEYKSDFIKNETFDDYTEADFEQDIDNPKSVSNQFNTLGWYYSEANTDEAYQDVTEYPFLRTVHSTLNPGTVLKALGGNKVDAKNNGQKEWLNGFFYNVPAAQEMYYLFGKDYYNGNITTEGEEVITKVIKSISIDVHGLETVIFTNTEGRVLASARSGGDVKFEVVSVIGEQGFIDVHIPQGIGSEDIEFLDSDQYLVYDLRNEEIVTNMSGGHLYRISLSPQNDAKTFITNSGQIVTEQDAKGIRYKVNYHDFSLNYYDEVGRPIKILQPKGFDETVFPTIKTVPNHNLTFASTYEYNSLNQLIGSTSPDEGQGEYKYRKDGQIRVSQNSKQQAVGEYSYTNYDTYGRPIESGVKVGNNFSSFNPNNSDGLQITGTKEQHYILYDEADVSGLHAALSSEGIDVVKYPKQNFIAGNVVKTYTVNPSTSTSWYSYDIYGRIEWVVQEIDGLGTKTIDYEYDPITSSISKIIYQKHIPSEVFIHRYSYNDANELRLVETSTDNVNFLKQAEYFYTEMGQLKRTILSYDIQGIDYVYNLSGQLKAINSPNIAPGLQNFNDPGNDGSAGNKFPKDAFGMSIDYYNGDYQRTNTPSPITSVTGGADQYNGNIKAITTKSSAPNAPEASTYYYRYNRSNWLESAGFNAYIEEEATAKVAEVLENIVIEDDNVFATDAITFLDGFHALKGVDFEAKITEPVQTEPTPGGDYDLTNLTYDKNGNLLSLHRNKQTENGSNRMDELTYNYKSGTNQLDHVSDAVTEATNADDIKGQSPNNYIYNSIGQLTQNVEEGIEYVYNVSGLVTEIKKNSQPLLKIYYNDKGHRIKKEAFIKGALENTETYVRDPSGNTMAIYLNGVQKELPIYGARRLGVAYRDGGAVYELTDHLGNVRTLIRGEIIKTLPPKNFFSGSTDYYPFGMPMPGRKTVGSELYRYAYQGQEVDPETGKEAFQLRLWDNRLGRWLSTDPMGQYHSPYMGMDNRPNMSIDPDGGCTKPPCNDDFDDGYLQEVVVIGKAAYNRTGYVYTDADYMFREHLRKTNNFYFKIIQMRERDGIFGPLKSAPGYWGDFSANFQAGAKNAKPGDIIYDLGKITATLIAAPLIVTNPVTAVFASNLQFASRSSAIINGATNLSGQLLTNGGHIEKVDFLDVGFSAVFKGSFYSSATQSIFDFSYSDGFQVNSSRDAIINYAVDGVVGSTNNYLSKIISGSKKFDPIQEAVYTLFFSTGTSTLGGLSAPLIGREFD